MEHRKLENAYETLIKNLESIIGIGEFSLCVYGSAVQNDFHSGISDIDILVLTNERLSDEQCASLLNLRQEIYEKTHIEECRYFEGAILDYDSFFDEKESSAVYWGTKKQRLEKSYRLDVFSRFVIRKYGRMLYGKADFREKIEMPSYGEMTEEIGQHLKVIREHARQTSGSIHSIGWLFDIARGLYTLKTGDVISKTDAAEWAIENNFSPDELVLEKAIALRMRPELLGTQEYSRDWLLSLGEPIQRFADVLKRELA